LEEGEMQSLFHVFKIIILVILFLPINLSAQNHTISGKILDGATNESLPFTNILIKGSNRGISADQDGKFTLSLPGDSYNLVFSFIGYKTTEIPVNLTVKDENISVKLYSVDNLLQTVTVYSGSVKNQTEEISNITLQNEKVGNISTVLKDVFRAVNTLPGISNNNEMSAKYNVRGGNFDENLVLVNGTQVYEPYHIKEASQVSFGIFNVDLMKKVDMMSGGFSAQFGDKMSSILNIDYREGNRERFSSAFSLNMLNLDALLEGPVNEKGSFIIAFRKSYFEYLLSYLGFDGGIKPSYYDLQGTFGYHLSPKNKLLFQFIHAGDDFKQDPYFEITKTNGTGTYRQEKVTYDNYSLDYENSKCKYYSNLFDLQSVNILNDNSILKAEISLYKQSDDEYSIDTFYYRQDIKSNNSYFYQYREEGIYSNILKINTLEGKVSFNYKPSLYHDIKTGISWQDIMYDQKYSDKTFYTIINNTDKYPDTVKTNSESNAGENAENKIDVHSNKLAGFIEDTWQISERCMASFGVRGDYFEINKDYTISPRFSISYASGFGTTIRAAWGHFYQSPVYSQLAYPYSTDSNAQSQKSIHYILGLEHNFHFGENNSGNILIKLESYYKDYSNLIASDRSSNWKINYSKKNDSKGYAKGIDLYINYMVPGFSCWVSYGLLEAKEKNNETGEEYFRFTNQTHTLSLVSDIELGKNWSLNLRMAYGSGYPYTPYTAVYNNTRGRWEWIAGKKNSEDMPFYKRIDSRISKTFQIGNFPADVYLDIINLFNFTNLLSYRYSFNDNGQPVRKENKLFPILPALGITVKY
jgi:outer membrane receptor for ferrienterochelin and colicin